MTDTDMDIVSLKQLADSLQMDRSHARRWILKKGFTPVKRRTADVGGALALSFTREEADRSLALRRAEGFMGSPLAAAVSDEYGTFYAV